jgi:photosystem II PsbZ protein
VLPGAFIQDKTFVRDPQRKMMLIFQIALLVLVLYSLLLVVAVPVLLSSASDWSRAKNVLLVGSLLWVLMVLGVGVLSFLK